MDLSGVPGAHPRFMTQGMPFMSMRNRDGEAVEEAQWVKTVDES